jgi:nucleoside triphosphate diphosphatase
MSAPLVPDPLAEALRLQGDAAKQGFDWDNFAELWEKLAEEIAELRAEAGDDGRAREELGDVLFMVVNIARHLRVDPAQALHGANRKFRRRFDFIMRHADSLPPPGDPHRLAAMEALWQQAKRHDSELESGAR